MAGVPSTDALVVGIAQALTVEAHETHRRAVRLAEVTVEYLAQPNVRPLLRRHLDELDATDVAGLEAIVHGETGHG